MNFLDRGGTNVLNSGTCFGLNTWYHAVATGDATGLKWYFNGNPDGSNAVAYGGASAATALVIGSTNGLGENFNGDIGLVRIYNRALSPTEVIQNCHAEMSRYPGSSCP